MVERLPVSDDLKFYDVEGLTVGLGGEEFLESHFGCIASLLNNEFHNICFATTDLIKHRFRSGHLFVITYGTATPEDADWYNSRIPTGIKAGQRIPVGVLETLAVNTHMKRIDPIKIRDYLAFNSYHILTAGGLWVPMPRENIDLLLGIDMTVLPTRRNSNGNGEAAGMAYFMLDQTRERKKLDNIKSIITCTPEGAQKVHTHLGARDLGVEVYGFRRGYFPTKEHPKRSPHIHPMEYIGLRDELFPK